MSASFEDIARTVCAGSSVPGVHELVTQTLGLYREEWHLHGITKTWIPWLAAGAAIHGIYAREKKKPPVDSCIARHTHLLPTHPAQGKRVLEMMLGMVRNEPEQAATSVRSGKARLARQELAKRMATLVRRADSLACTGTSEAKYPTLLAAEDTPTEAGIKILQHQFCHFVSLEYGLPLREDPEFVHEMRVATRRMRATLNVFHNWLGPWAAMSKKQLSVIADELGSARDSDVFRQFLNSYARRCAKEDLPFIDALMHHEKTIAKQSAGRVIRYVGLADHRLFVSDFKRQMSAHLTEDSMPGREQQETLAELVPSLLRRQLKRVLKYDSPLAEYTSEELHALRISCKRLRYTAEFFAELYADGLHDLVDLGSSMQNLLGDVHDADVYRERIEACLREHLSMQDRVSHEAEQALYGYLHAWRNKQLKKAATRWKKTQAKRQRRNLIATASRSPVQPACG